MDRSRPFENGRNPQAVELGFAVMAFVNLDAGNRMAMTFVRQRIELAVAAIFAGAVDEFEPFNFPRRHGDLRPLRSRVL